MTYIKSFGDISLEHVGAVGGKNASLGAMIRDLSGADIRIPDGFAVTVDAYWEVIAYNSLQGEIEKYLNTIEWDNTSNIQAAGARLRALFYNATIPPGVKDDIVAAYTELSEQYGVSTCDVAVRSSATAEDLPGASFAGQMETYLAVRGVKDVLEAYKKCLASLFNDRALVYRHEKGFSHTTIGISVGIQKMVRSDKASAGVAFSLETETGIRSFVTISSSYGLGELLVQGLITPDEFYVHKNRLEEGFRPIVLKQLGAKEEKRVVDDKGRIQTQKISPQDRDRFSISDDHILEIARAVIAIEILYQKTYPSISVDVEWAIDGDDGLLYIVQARPETVHSVKKDLSYTLYALDAKQAELQTLVRGTSIGNVIVHGRARIIKTLKEALDFVEGDILVTGMTDPDWVPLLRKAGGVVTERGGRTCHAAIVSRELGIPAIVGAQDAMERLSDKEGITLDCSQGSIGSVYKGSVAFSTQTFSKTEIPALPVEVMINLGDPGRACDYSRLPVAGVGLARLEFIIASMINIHPMAVLFPQKIVDKAIFKAINERAKGYEDPRTFYVNVLAQAIGLIAGAFYPRPVLVRLTDFKSNEYRDLLGGMYFEPIEANPMIGFRGAVRYTSELYEPAFALECEALTKACEYMGFDNIKVMIPFVRTLNEAQQSVALLKKHGLERGNNGLEMYMMVEIPSNVLLLQDFSPYFDGFSIGSNDLTQLVLGADRDSALIAPLFDERDPAVMKAMKLAIDEALHAKKPIGICGQAPSDYPDLAQKLIEAGISSISLNPDAVLPFIDQY